MNNFLKKCSDQIEGDKVFMKRIYAVIKSNSDQNIPVDEVPYSAQQSLDRSLHHHPLNWAAMMDPGKKGYILEERYLKIYPAYIRRKCLKDLPPSFS